ncbi:hypothetical protein AS850_03470 [Frondihabitans sp. 762G35]|nr:hypothetical protein AS850_03470 [Frondihabitans sp. 762G35]
MPTRIGHASQLVDELTEMLLVSNGFHAFEGALVVRAADGSESGLDAWNDAASWRSDYGDLADGLVFFAEDVFGGQFAIDDRSVVTFDPETGARSTLATSIEGWAEAVLEDFPLLTGHPLAREWQEQNGALPPGRRLAPVIPFVLGGAFSVDNLRAVADVQGMRERATLTTRIRDLPDGAQLPWPLGAA